MRGFDVADFLNALVNPFLLIGALVTAGLTVVGLLGGFGCGLLVALLRSTPNPVVQRRTLEEGGLNLVADFGAVGIASVQEKIAGTYPRRVEVAHLGHKLAVFDVYVVLPRL